MDRNAEIAKALADALAKRLYEAHAEWTIGVFAAGEAGVVVAQWAEMGPIQRDPYVALADRLICEGHLEGCHLIKKIDLHG